MDQTRIFGPFFCMMALTAVVWVYLYARRIPFIRASRLSAEQLQPLEFARLSPAAVSNPSDNLKNLFEMPTVFYAVVVYLYVTSQVDGTYLAAAWAFAAFRALHSAVHCTRNIVMVRFWLYCASSFALWFMALRAGVRFCT